MQRVLKVFLQSNRAGDIFKSNLNFELLKKNKTLGIKCQVLEGLGRSWGVLGSRMGGKVNQMLRNCIGGSWSVML